MLSYVRESLPCMRILYATILKSQDNNRMIRSLLNLSFIIALCIGLVSCQKDAYDTGDGGYSYLRADFVMAHTLATKTIDYVINDDGDSIVPTSQIAASWATIPDSIYRALFYYNAKESGAEPLTISRVPVLTILTSSNSTQNTLKTDPIVFKSAWLSKKRAYLNLDIGIKTGNTDNEKAKQILGAYCEKVVANNDGTHDIYIRILHDQSSVPEYYTSTVYVSIDVSKIYTGDTIHLLVNSYDGDIKKDFKM